MKIRGLVLSIYNYRENDRFIICYTRELGKIEILVRGAKKITSKLAPLTSGFYSLINLVVEPGKNYYHLIGGEIEKYFYNLNNNYKKIIQTGQIFKIVDKITKYSKPDYKIFDLLVKTLEKIDTGEESKIEVFVYAFLIKFLSFLGYKPEIKKCLICQKIPVEEVNFDIRQGGIICLNCQNRKENILKRANLKLFQDLLYKDFDFLEKRKFNFWNFLLVKSLINKFLKWHLE